MVVVWRFFPLATPFRSRQNRVHLDYTTPTNPLKLNYQGHSLTPPPHSLRYPAFVAVVCWVQFVAAITLKVCARSTILRRSSHHHHQRACLNASIAPSLHSTHTGPMAPPLGNGSPAEDADTEAGPAVVVEVEPLNGVNRISSRRGKRAPPTDETDATTMGEHLRTQFRDYFLGTCMRVGGYMCSG